MLRVDRCAFLNQLFLKTRRHLLDGLQTVVERLEPLIGRTLRISIVRHPKVLRIRRAKSKLKRRVSRLTVHALIESILNQR